MSKKIGADPSTPPDSSQDDVLDGETGEPIAGAPPGAPAVPPGMVVLTQAEHNRLQAATRANAKREKAERERQDAERLKAAREAGEFDSALAQERERTNRLERQLVMRDVRDAVRDQISALGYSGSRATGLMKLVDLDGLMGDGAEMPDADSVSAAVDATVAQFPDLFALPAADGDAPAAVTPGARPPAAKPARRPMGPAAPPDAKRSGLPADYVSPEEYSTTPHAVRHGLEFRERVRKSRPYWPTKVPADSFAVGQG